MNSKRRMVLVVGVGCALTVLAEHANAESNHDPCALVTQAQVAEAVGAKVDPGQPIGKTGCQWSSDSKDKSGHVMITLSIWDAKMFPTKSTPGITLKPASGMGDQCVFGTLGDLTALFVKKGNSTLQFRVYGLHDTAKQEAIETSIAKAALGRW